VRTPSERAIDYVLIVIIGVGAGWHLDRQDWWIATLFLVVLCVHVRTIWLHDRKDGPS